MGFIVVGNPGIGKTMLLYYLLASRLLKRQPTNFQYRRDILLVFDANGVSTLFPEDEVVRQKGEDIWALVDCNHSVAKPASAFVRASSPAFLIVASPPLPDRWASYPYLVHAALYVSRTHSSTPSRELQLFKREESDIQDFFEAYGPSTRDCYGFCDNLEHFHPIVCDSVAAMSWDTLTKALTMGVLLLDEGSHRVVLVEPPPKDAYQPQIRIVTKAINQILWEYDSIKRGRNHRQLYRTLRLDHSFSGTFVEPVFHDLCVKGTTLTIYPIVQRWSVDYIFVNYPRTRAKTLVLPQQTRVLFSRKNPVTSLPAGHYYQPTYANQPSYDSFVFDSTLSQLSLFQVSDGETHDFKPKGIYALRDLATEFHVKDLKLRFIIVVPENARVTCPVEREMYDNLHLEMYTVEVTENELYGD